MENLKTDHFEVHFHSGAERTARTVAKIAEDIYAPITDLYDWEPDGIVHFIIKDFDDNSNGAAYYYDNKVEIWAPQMSFILRGTHNLVAQCGDARVLAHDFSGRNQTDAAANYRLFICRCSIMKKKNGRMCSKDIPTSSPLSLLPIRSYQCGLPRAWLNIWPRDWIMTDGTAIGIC
jgi:hypothetical protein